MWKKIRILCLLLVLLVVAVNAWRDQNQDWTKPIIVLLHPINADGRTNTQNYINTLNIANLNTAQDYLKQASQQYRRQPVALYFKLGRELKQMPPKVPTDASLLSTVLWSLKFRFYAWQQRQGSDGAATVTLYLNYYDPSQTQILKHSTALQKGKIGSVNLFASNAHSQRNTMVMVHELLHAFGATDKYDLATGQPIYPIGYAAPNQQPLYPQQQAELMAGYIPLSQSKSKMPESLEQTRINEITAIELGWK
ncbi:hypothetical protein MXL26_10415 [Acinetobacter towneri]|uniref:hypothetical protein n=1 Tax=Acinetobacter towneri TaxID=202956 RepID=UPI002DB6F588|nr:hypothetical protein [Acinetobacter towneri]MEB6565752.1 hypothetical protein [Acinetobacter towneri]